MFKFAVTTAASLFGLSEAKVANDNIHFVQEVVRHGARAPTMDSEGFEVAAGELTASGMRQRYLLGNFNRVKYIDNYELLNSREQINVQTTHYDRTFQSGYSELMGLFPPGSLKENEKLSHEELLGLEVDLRGMPPINIRDAETLNYKLRRDPLPNGFVSVPIFEFQNPTIWDDIGYWSCDYVSEVDGYNFPNDNTYSSVWYLMDDLRAPISDAFGLSPTEEANMNFMELYDYCDVIQSREFEGVPLNYTYTQEQLDYVN